MKTLSNQYKNLKNILLTLLTVLIFTACEEVVTPDLDTAAPRLVVNANIQWYHQQSNGNSQEIDLSLSTPFYTDTPSVPVTNATVSVTNLNTNQVFDFTHQGIGKYATSNFEPILGNTYQLNIEYNNENYTATETFTKTPSINNITQSVAGGFDSEATEVNVFFTDDANTEDYYLIEYFSNRAGFPKRNTFRDEFLNGNEIKTFAETSDQFNEDEEKLQAGDVVNIQLYGISKQFYNYFDLLLQQDESQGPFATTPVPLRGNVINTNNSQNYAFGYFRCNQVVSASYTVQ